MECTRALHRTNNDVPSAIGLLCAPTTADDALAAQRAKDVADECERQERAERQAERDKQEEADAELARREQHVRRCG